MGIHSPPPRGPLREREPQSRSPSRRRRPRNCLLQSRSGVVAPAHPLSSFAVAERCPQVPHYTGVRSTRHPLPRRGCCCCAPCFTVSRACELLTACDSPSAATTPQSLSTSGGRKASNSGEQRERTRRPSASGGCRDLYRGSFG